MSYEPKYFKMREFGCRCCGTVNVKDELLVLLDKLREHFGVPVMITSGTRCEKHNKAVGGAKASQHLFGTAADVKVKGVDPNEVHKYLTKTYPNEYGIGKYNTFTHVDVRSYKARW